jgi:hypothetical protein
LQIDSGGAEQSPQLASARSLISRKRYGCSESGVSRLRAEKRPIPGLPLTRAKS